MSEKDMKFGDKKVNKSNFYKNKELFKIETYILLKKLVSKKAPCGKESIKQIHWI